MYERYDRGRSNTSTTHGVLVKHAWLIRSGSIATRVLHVAITLLPEAELPDMEDVLSPLAEGKADLLLCCDNIQALLPSYNLHGNF